MSETPLISVLLPVYNASSTLPLAIGSILGQDWDDWELVAVNDGSTDDSAELIYSFTQKDSRIRLLDLPHAGIARALNTAAIAAQGSLLARMDADDVSHAARLSKQARFLNHHPEVDVLSCCVNYGGDAEANRGYAGYVDWTNSLLSHEQITLARFIESPLAHPSVMMRRDALVAAGGYADGPFPEDYELWLRMAEKGFRFAKLPDVLLTWNDPPGRLSRTDERYSTAAFFRMKTVYLARAVRKLEETAGKRPVWIWGAGRVTRRRAEMLSDAGIEIAGFIDIDPAKTGKTTGGKPVVHFESIPSPGEWLIVPFVTSRGAGALIREELERRGYQNGWDFIEAG